MRQQSKQPGSAAMSWCRQFVLLFLAVLLTVGATCALTEPTGPRLYYFSAANCPHCVEYGPRLKALVARHPAVILIEHDIWDDRQAFQLLVDLLATHGETLVGTPTVMLGDRAWVGLDELALAEIEAAIEECLARGCPDARARLSGVKTEQRSETSVDSAAANPLELPLLGTVDPRAASLPLVTVVLGLLDSVNPCAFFVLLFLLSLMVHAHSRGRMLTVGVVFVGFSGLIYFLFMAAWLNLFLATGGIAIVTSIAGVVALTIGGFNIKDFFLWQRGPSLSIPERVKPTLYQRVRKLVQASNYATLLGGTVILAIAANSYELLCTAGLPMVYTRILTLHGLSTWQYYTYLAFYNAVYVIPLLAIVIVFAVTLGAHRLSERGGRVLKLLSGMMMGAMGLVLLLAPTWLSTLSGTVLLVLAALLATGLVLILCRRQAPWHEGKRPPAKGGGT